MGDSCVETSEAPAWLLKLEKQREKLSKARLGHDSGAGAPCNSCGSKCPGLDLHFWRKVCRACHCSKDVHDVQDDDLSGWAQFQLLGTARPKNKGMMATVKIKGLSEEAVKVEWVPPHAPLELVEDYMESLGGLAPVSGSAGARRRREQLRTQVPPHDAEPARASHASAAERADHEEYVARVRGAAAGRGRVVRVRALARLVPGLVLRPAGAAPRDAPLTAPPLAARLRLGPARLASALAHPELYDRVFAALEEHGLDAAADAQLRPVLRLRAALRCDPRLAAALPPPPPAAADEGVIFGLGGQMWAWRREAAAGDVRSARVSPQLARSAAAPRAQEPQLARPLRRAEDDDPPPLPNYHTYPDMSALLAALPAADEATDTGDAAEPEEPEAEADGAEDAGAVVPFAGMSAEEAAEFERRLHGEGVPCRGCGGALFAGCVAVWAARAGAGAVWHPACFACHACGELLADLVYCWWRGALYCARDLAAALDVPRCAGCDELIFARPYTAAEGRAFHVQHFCCYRCDAPLGGGVYVPDEAAGLPVCVSCFERHSAERCRACGGPIGPEQQGVSWAALHWHADCFVCSGRSCARSLLSGKFVVKQDMPFCSVPCVRSRIQ